MADGLREGVDDEGLIDDPYQRVETRYCPLEAVLEEETYLRIIGDDGPTNVEIRVPLADLERNGWTRPSGGPSGRGGRVMPRGSPP
jgi:hypothetical protein